VFRRSVFEGTIQSFVVTDDSVNVGLWEDEEKICLELKSVFILYKNKCGEVLRQRRDGK
jgi:hypothetical protein